jgi:hypothetical protein
MNCKDFDNLLLETLDLKEISKNAEAKQHIDSCENCHARLEMEIKLRNSFNEIAQELPPLELTKKILEIPSSEVPSKPNLWQTILSSLSEFPFKVAFASCIAGFLLAISMRGIHYVPKQLESTGKQQIAKHERTIGKLAQKTKESAKGVEIESEERFDIAKKTTRSAPPAPKREAIINLDTDEKIPGAITYSLQEAKDLEDAITADKETQPAQFAMAPSPNFSKAGKSESNLRPLKLAKARAKPRLRSAPRIELEAKSFSDDFCMLKSDLDELKQNHNNDIAQQIANIVEQHRISISEGPIKPMNWAIQGLITPQKAKQLQPPSGKIWWAKKEGNSWKFFLKNKK